MPLLFFDGNCLQHPSLNTKMKVVACVLAVFVANVRANIHAAVKMDDMSQIKSLLDAAGKPGTDEYDEVLNGIGYGSSFHPFPQVVVSQSASGAGCLWC
jgi:hypothetical protein